MARTGMTGSGRATAAPRSLTRSLIAVPGLVAVAILLAAGCSTAVSRAAGSQRIVRVTAAENFWGSIARQLGGRHAHVISIISNPNADPHSYEPTAADARAVASSRIVIENGVGYDPWMARLLAADDGAGISVLNVGAALGVPTNGNPHRWYKPADVHAVIAKLTQRLSRADPADRRYFASREARLTQVGLHRYDELIASIRRRFRGTPVGASESIFAMLAPALGLRLVTPAAFLKAITEGTEVSAADKQTVDTQISRHLIKIYVYNSQNVTPDVRAQLAAARAARTPVASITETLTPPTASFQAWQVRQLAGIEHALAIAAGRQA